MAELKTKIILRNDSTANWSENSSVVLLKGEVGIEFLSNGKTKIKIGDGVKTWAELDYFGCDFDSVEAAIAALKSDVSKINEVLFPSAEGSQTLLSRVETLESVAASVDQKITDSINAFAEKISDDGKINTLKELVDYVAEHGAETIGLVNSVKTLQDLVGQTPVSEQISVASTALLAEISKTEEKLKVLSEGKKYEITGVPAGTLVDYREKEIRVMCPVGTEFVKQSVGANGNENMYYMTFKAYAPEGAVSFKEGDRGVIIDEMFTFDDAAAGVDKYGRKYSVCWLALASYDAASGTWNYFGKTSSTSKYIGWNYVVEWYDANGKVIGSDSIRINLSNEGCHSAIEPFYMNSVVKGVKVNGTLLDLVNGEVEIEVPVIKSSDDVNKISVAKDGTMSVNSISVNNLVQEDGEFIILNGGSSI